MMGIRICNNRIFTINIKTFDISLDCCREYVCRMKSRIRVQFRIPCLFKLGNHFRIRHLLISWEVCRRCTHITGALYIVLTTKRVDTTALTAKFTYKECHIGHGHNTLCTGRMLCYTKAVNDRSLICLCIHDGCFS